MDENATDIGHNDPNFEIHNMNDNMVLENIYGIVFITILMILGIPGNSSALLVYLRKYKPSTYRTFIVSLAIVDLGACCISMPFIIVVLRYPILFPNDEVCKVFRFLSYIPCVSSVFILITIAVERYRKICIPYGTQVSKRMSKYICILDLLAGCFLSWPAALIYGKRTVKTEVSYISGTSCSVSDDYVNTKYPEYYSFVVGIVLFASLMALAIIYCLIGMQIFRMKKTDFGMNHLQPSQDNTVRTLTTEFSSLQADENKKGDCLDCGKKDYFPNEFDAIKKRNKRRHKTIRITRVVFVITVVLICSFLTPAAFRIARAVDKSFPQNLSFPGIVAYRIFQWTFFISNVANPVIYGFCDKRFMEEICRFYRSLTGICLTRK